MGLAACVPTTTGQATTAPSPTLQARRGGVLTWAQWDANAAIWGAIAAGVLVTGIGVALKHPLTRVPENTMKFGVGAMLTSFGVFWTAEGLGIEWPGDALSLFAILGVILVVSWVSVRMLAAMLPSGARVEARNV